MTVATPRPAVAGPEPAGVDNRLVVGGTPLTWRTLPTPTLSDPAAVLAHSAGHALAAARQHAVHGTELLLSTASRVDATMRAELLDAGFTVTELDDDGVRPSAPARPRTAEPGRLWLLTSGSTGRPKRVGHTLDTLTTVRADQPDRTWLCPYAPGTYAWWQVVTLSLTQPGQHLVVVEPDELDDWPAVAAAHGVDAASGTPTFWRRTLYRDAAALARVPLRQLTLGGEPVDQAILDQLRDVFPAARISWIYASSEVGASIVVHDGRAGFPVEWLDRETPGRPTLSVHDDELVVTSPYHGAGLAGPVRTGDRVQVVDGRVLITGRLDSDEINVGGSKVSAGVVRGVLTGHPGVAWARVTGRRAPVLGRMVVADVVLTPPDGPADPADRSTTGVPDEAALVRWCADRLPEHAVPRRIRVLTEIPVKETLKSDV
ncbi:AMP-binding protein [Micromonospora lupini]|uniref:Acyl-CoA synthetase (AMP-forming)/AMP-acid ligase II-like protein n=1 Tax=Micromonospora lupini str. Lupac 08 TaxID=1150864 RepID=I0L0B8_9ACTN|nr:AMP-binding protein [Micromonospora lupini]CCH17265.1 Acyl-CoA synthetase (AMP-forming)/AMP-acid ligase II-like protein [Micromonospora lupini str. Lupac 08]